MCRLGNFTGQAWEALLLEGALGNVKDLSGKVFGQLTVLSFSHTTTSGAFWLCRCTCGNEKVVPSRLLKNGRAVSCGCKKVKIVRSTIERSIERRREMFGVTDWSVSDLGA